jgi:hypothetical protein
VTPIFIVTCLKGSCFYQKMPEVLKRYSEHQRKITCKLKLKIYYKIICLNIFFRFHYLSRTELSRNVSKKISLY